MRPLLLILLFVWAAHAQQSTIDWEKARGLHQRAQLGEKLSTEEQQYYDEARRQMESRNAANPELQRAQEIHRRKQAGEKITEEEEKFLAEAMRRRGGGAPQSPPPPPPENLVPLTELSGNYHDQDGGLYGAGRNEPPAELATRAMEAARQIQPLNAGGKSASDGRIVLMSIGMSNTTQSFSAFKRFADADARKSGMVAIVDAAQGGRTAMIWATQDQPWEEATRRLDTAKVTAAQVQALWIKQANAGPSGDWPTATNQLRDDLRRVISRAKEKYPNVRLIFLSSRTYAGYATTRLNPEPYAYESAFAVRALIREQPGDGPALLWGPYLWTNGKKGRALDAFKWTREDVAPDGTHPSRTGQEKVGRLLLDFFANNPYAKPWFATP